MVISLLKGTVCVISSEPPCLSYNGTLQKPFLINYELDINIVGSLNYSFSFRVSLHEEMRFSGKYTLFGQYYLTDLDFKGTVINLALSSLHGGSLASTHTVPLVGLFLYT